MQVSLDPKLSLTTHHSPLEKIEWFISSESHLIEPDETTVLYPSFISQHYRAL